MGTSSTFEINTEVDNGNARIAMSGEADFTRAGVIDDAVDKVMREEPKSLVIDLDGLTLIASLAIGALVSCASSVRKRGGTVKTINVGDNVSEVLMIANLGGILGME